ncbi:MAG: FtsK/SpoIIIE domain-containing protein [Verrucomicrobiota bacterium]|nr:FtsK/SpoIIIE domain-containing protein [Verrucomicrobiota bacterium]
MAERVISVSQLKCACLDEDWRRRWRHGEKPPTQSFPATGGAPVQGALFHQLAERFTEWLESAREMAALRDGEALWAELYDRFARARLDELIVLGRLPSAHYLSEALRAFCDRLAELRARTPRFTSWQDLYLTREFRLDRIRFPLASGELLISGRPDAVRLQPQGRVEVVDYKLSRGGNLKHDLVQLAIYARLLRAAKPGLVFDGVLEFYEPALHAVRVMGAELDGLFEEIVQPVMQELAGGGPREPETSASPGDSIAAAIQRCYADFKLHVEILSRQEAPQLVRYSVRPASGVRVVSLANRGEDLQVALRLKQPPLIQAAPGCVTIDIPKETPDPVHWRDLARGGDPAGSPLAFPIGVGMDNALLSADLADANMCHALVAGASGSGKSEFLKCVAASLLARHSPATLRLSVIDPKILTFGALKTCRHLTGPLITELASAIACLEAAVRDMDARYERLAREGFENLAQRGPREEMPFHVVIFDEFGDLVLSGRRERELFESLVGRLAQKGRAAGIHLVLTTQRPDSKIVTGLIKSNLPLKICLRVTTAVNSQIVLDEPGAETLLGRGDLLCNRGRGIERAQSPIITQEELRAIAG